MDKKRSEQLKSIVVSGLRILATAGIFVFHILGLYGFNNRRIDFFSILIFCFLSGYLLYGAKFNSLGWLKKRFLAIMIPYWLVIIPVLIINRLISYKETSMLEDIITLLGGNLFLETKVYVIAWYITFVLLLYDFVYFQSFFKGTFFKIFVWIIGLIIFGTILDKLYYFVSFGAGFFLSKSFHPPDKAVSKSNYLTKGLFILQNNCYAFFLIHGGVLLFFFSILGLNFINTFFFGLSLTILGTIGLTFMTNALLEIMHKKNINFFKFLFKTV